MKTIKQLIKKHNFNWVNPNITEENFPVQERKGKVEYKLFHFDCDISSEDAIKEMAREGYEPATITDLLTWGEWNGKDNVLPNFKCKACGKCTKDINPKLQQNIATKYPEGFQI